jgi:UDP-N-acetylmuramoyl-tripeptide--D-alanyl-D-alanine ligase
MKEIFRKKILRPILRVLAERTLRRYEPKVIGITGSVGKTTVKEAVYKVLSARFSVKRNEENFNNEIGVPMTILGLNMAHNIGWLANIIKGIKVAYGPKIKYPEYLILELAADKPGDMDYLVQIAKPQVGIVTVVGAIPVHVEYYASPKAVAAEKSKLIKSLPTYGLSILNYDDQTVLDMKECSKGKLKTVGFADGADIKATEKFLFVEGNDMGVSFKIHHGDTFVPMKVKGLLGFHQIYAVLAAAAVGVHYGMNLIQVSEIFKEFHPPKGRMKLVKGIKETLIIDDTYNASPESTHAALEALSNIARYKDGRKIAVLGDMLELGRYSITAHQNIGNFAAKHCDMLFCVGSRAKWIADAAENQMKEGSIFTFNTSSDAGRVLQDQMRKGDVILIKGSRGMKMERVVEEIEKL